MIEQTYIIVLWDDLHSQPFMKVLCDDVHIMTHVIENDIAVVNDGIYAIV